MSTPIYRRLSYILFIVALFAGLLGGCAPTVEEPTAPPTEAPAETITVTDARGREVTFEEPPRRIVIAGRANFMLNDAVYLFPEARERVIGLAEATQETDWLDLIDPGIDEKARFPFDAGAEEIAALNPDLVLLKSFMAEPLGNAVEELGIPVVYLDLETPEQYYRDLAILGALFDAPERAAELTAFYQNSLDEIETALEGLEEEEKPQVLLMHYDTRGDEAAFKVPPESWIQTWMVEFAGGRPVWENSGGGWNVVNLEQLAAWNPDKIFVISYFTDVDGVAAMLQSDPLWQSLEAVQAGELYAFPKDYYSWDQPDSRWILGLKWLAQRLHPESFAELDVMEEVYTFYEELYGIDRPAVDEVIVPRLQGDVE
ncbi:MAG: ABC transporter substrate-binding protein [Anaerolineales bacterium]